MAKPQPNKPGRKRLVLLLAVFFLLTALAVGLWVFPSSFPRLQIAGYRISQEEYLQAMYQARNEVLSDHAAAGISLKDWTAETALGDPCQLTVDRALEILSRTYAVSTLAVERGYLESAGYDDLLRDMEDINRQRREALDSGALVTGLPQFSLADYLTYRESSLRLQFCTDPENPENQVTEQELRQRYEADLENLYQQPDSLELVVLLADAAPGEYEQLHRLFEQARSLGSIPDALEELPQLKDYCQELSIGPDTYAAYARTHSDVLQWASQLETGELSQVIGQENRLCLIQCIRKTVHDAVPLEDVQSVVLQSIRESRYDELIAERMALAEILGDLPSLYRFTAEQLP